MYNQRLEIPHPDSSAMSPGLEEAKTQTKAKASFLPPAALLSVYFIMATERKPGRSGYPAPRCCSGVPLWWENGHSDHDATSVPGSVSVTRMFSVRLWSLPLALIAREYSSEFFSKVGTAALSYAVQAALSLKGPVAMKHFLA